MKRMATAKPTKRSSTVPICITIPYLVLAVTRGLTDCNGVVRDKDGLAAHQSKDLFLNPQASLAVLLPGLSALPIPCAYRQTASCTFLGQGPRDAGPEGRCPG